MYRKFTRANKIWNRVLRLYHTRVQEGGVFFSFHIFNNGGNQKRSRHISWKVAFEISLQLFAFRLALGITCKTDFFSFFAVTRDLYETSRYMFVSVFHYIGKRNRLFFLKIIFGMNNWLCYRLLFNCFSITVVAFKKKWLIFNCMRYEEHSTIYCDNLGIFCE